MLSAKDVMVSPAITVNPDETVEQVAHKFLDHHIGDLPVVDPDGKLVGLVPENALLDMFNHASLSKGVVADFMMTNVVSVDADQTVSAAVAQIVDHGIPRIPVIAEGRVVGMISRREVLRRACEDVLRRCERDWLKKLQAV